MMNDDVIGVSVLVVCYWLVLMRS